MRVYLCPLTHHFCLTPVDSPAILGLKQDIFLNVLLFFFHFCFLGFLVRIKSQDWKRYGVECQELFWFGWVGFFFFLIHTSVSSQVCFKPWLIFFICLFLLSGHKIELSEKREGNRTEKARLLRTDLQTCRRTFLN